MSGVLGILVRKELAELRRDRRVLLLSLVLPVLIYPVIIGGMDRLESRRQAQTRQQRLSIATDGQGPLFTALAADTTLAWRTGPADSLRPWVQRGEVALAVDLPDRLPALGATTPDTVRLWVRRTRESGQEAERRIRDLLRDALAEERQHRWELAGGEGDLESVLVLVERNLASAAAESGARASRMLVYLLLMTLFMGGSALATDMVAGEKERQTLETLFLAPVDRIVIARAKLLVVSAGTVLTGLASLGSLSVSYALGWIGGEAGGQIVLEPRAILGIALLLVPLAVLLGAALLALSAWARSLKEAQYYSLPLMLVILVPALMSMSQSIELTPLVALLPIANVAFVMRDVLLGRLESSTLVLVLVSTLFWTWVVLRQVAHLISREETVLGFDPEPLLARTPGGRRRAATLGMAGTVLAYFYLGQWLQAWDLRAGLALSLWLLLPLLGMGTALLVRPDWKGRWRTSLGLRGAPPAAVAGAWLLGWGLMLPIAGGLQRLQAGLLPMTESQADLFGQAMQGLGPAALFGLAALSPAVCEEFVFRGIFLGILRPLGSARWALLWSSFWFALIHLSIYRFAPTFLLGLVLGALVLRHRSLLPASVLHLTYNGTLLLGGGYAQDHALPLKPDGVGAWGISVFLLVVGALLAFGARGGHRSLPSAPQALD